MPHIRLFTVRACILGAAALIATNDLTAAPLTIGGDFSQRIPAHGNDPGPMDPLTLTVSDSMIIDDIDISLDLTHTEVSDLRITLLSPWGDTILLKEQWEVAWRNPRPNMHGTIFDDDAMALLDPESRGAYTGRFLPADRNALAAMAGHDAIGTWQLNILDTVANDIGTLDHWEIRINTAHIPESTTTLYLLSFLCLFRLRPVAGSSTNCPI